MTTDRLEIISQPSLKDGRMVLAFSGWMDGGDVSTGTVEWLAKTLGARKVAGIDPEDFNIYSFPGSMELSALFRPHTEIQDGMITTYRPPENTFLCHEDSDLILFQGREPNFNWSAFAECLFSFASRAGVSVVYFVGSYGGAVPHSREPRLMSTVSDERLKPLLEQHGIGFTDYEGPASFATYLMRHASSRGLLMASLVAEIPAYVQGTNPRCIESVIRKLTAILGLQVKLDDLRKLSAAWEEKLNNVLEPESDLAKHVKMLEENYDNDVFDTQMGDLKEWLEQRGIRVD